MRIVFPRLTSPPLAQLSFEFNLGAELMEVTEDIDVVGRAESRNLISWIMRTNTGNEKRPPPDWISVLRPRLSKVLETRTKRQAQFEGIRIQLLNRIACPKKLNMNQFFNIGFLQIPEYLQSFNKNLVLSEQLPYLMSSNGSLSFVSRDSTTGYGITFETEPDRSQFLLQTEAIWQGDLRSVAECIEKTESLYEILCLLFFAFTTRECQESFGLYDREAD